MEDEICVCGHKESMHIIGRKDGVSACMDCIEEGLNNNLSECEGFTERQQFGLTCNNSEVDEKVSHTTYYTLIPGGNVRVIFWKPLKK